MEQQEIFDTVVRHLFEQGVQAASEDGYVCFYRMPNGNRCAAGKLIPDEVYRNDMEGISIVGLTKYPEFDLPTDIFNDENIPIIQMLQAVHDDRENWISTDAMQSALRNCVRTIEEINDSINVTLRNVRDLRFSDR